MAINLDDHFPEEFVISEEVKISINLSIIHNWVKIIKENLQALAYIEAKNDYSNAIDAASQYLVEQDALERMLDELTSAQKKNLDPLALDKIARAILSQMETTSEAIKKILAETELKAITEITLEDIDAAVAQIRMGFISLYNLYFGHSLEAFEYHDINEIWQTKVKPQIRLIEEFIIAQFKKPKYELSLEQKAINDLALELYESFLTDTNARNFDQDKIRSLSLKIERASKERGQTKNELEKTRIHQEILKASSHLKGLKKEFNRQSNIRYRRFRSNVIRFLGLTN